VLVFRETVPFSGYLSIISEVKEGKRKMKMRIHMRFLKVSQVCGMEWRKIEKKRIHIQGPNKIISCD